MSGIFRALFHRSTHAPDGEWQVNAQVKIVQFARSFEVLNVIQGIYRLTFLVVALEMRRYLESYMEIGVK